MARVRAWPEARLGPAALRPAARIRPHVAGHRPAKAAKAHHPCGGELSAAGLARGYAGRALHPYAAGDPVRLPGRRDALGGRRTMPNGTKPALAGQAALVTGGSSGIGAGVVEALAAAGAAVAINFNA